jgi:hypothetical protein
MDERFEHSSASVRFRRTNIRVLAAAGVALLLILPTAKGAEAAPGSLTYTKDGNAFVSPADGGAESQVTRDGTPSDPYLSASQSASGTIVALRHDKAFRLAQSGQQLARPISLGISSTGAGMVSADGGTLAYEIVGACGINRRACVSTGFHSLSSDTRLAGEGTQMTNPTWVDGSVVGAVAGGVDIVGPSQAGRQQWFGYAESPLPQLDIGTRYVESAAASRGGTRLAVTTSADSQGTRVLWLLTSSALGATVEPICWQEVPPGPEAHVVWAPDGSAIAWEEADGVWTQSVVDLTGTDAGCQANSDTARLVGPGGIRPSWSEAPYDPRPIASNSPVPSAPTAKQPMHSARGSFRLASRPRLARALRDGLDLLVKCPESCTATATARIDSRTARRFRLGRRTTIVGRGSLRRVEPGTTKTLRLHFSRRAQRQLRRARRVQITLKVTLRYQSGAMNKFRKLLLRR